MQEVEREIDQLLDSLTYDGKIIEFDPVFEIHRDEPRQTPKMQVR